MARRVMEWQGGWMTLTSGCQDVVYPPRLMAIHYPPGWLVAQRPPLTEQQHTAEQLMFLMFQD